MAMAGICRWMNHVLLEVVEYDDLMNYRVLALVFV